jgi:hypothetical protein
VEFGSIDVLMMMWNDWDPEVSKRDVLSASLRGRIVVFQEGDGVIVDNNLTPMCPFFLLYRRRHLVFKVVGDRSRSGIRSLGMGCSSLEQRPGSEATERRQS